jgi:hypothetical protein
MVLVILFSSVFSRGEIEHRNSSIRQLAKEIEAVRIKKKVGHTIRWYGVLLNYRYPVSRAPDYRTGLGSGSYSRAKKLVSRV